MDGRRFDSLARAMGRAASRRAALLGAIAALLPLAGAAKPGRPSADDGKPGGPASEACLANGQRCGKGSGRRGKPCATCCSRHSVAQANGRRRCACKPAGARAGNAAQCCAGRANAAGICGGCEPGGCPGDGCCDAETGACVADRACCPSGGICRGGACEPTATLAQCGGRCDCDEACDAADPIRAFVACPGGGEVPCPPCDGGCQDAGCPLSIRTVSPDPAPSYRCVTADVTGLCAGDQCPAGEACAAAPDPPIAFCMEVCTGA